MLTRLLAFLKLSSTLRFRAWVIGTLTKSLNIDVGWVLSEDRQKVHFELYLKRQGANPYAGYEAKVVTNEVAVVSSVNEWALVGFDFKIDWFSDSKEHSEALRTLKVADFIDSNRKFR